MLFNSFEFIIFLPIVFILYWFVFNRNTLIQNVFIIVASYIFYGWWDRTFLLLIFITSLCSYLSGIGIDYLRKRGSTGKVMAVANIVLNLLILGVYKYYNFFVDSLADLMHICGVPFHTHSLQLILPVGISFYTFQALSYTIDVYKNKLQATYRLDTFMAYICFFPQLVAGPIERATQLLPQFAKSRTFSGAEAADGCRQMLWGFFKKMVIADNCAPIVDEIFSNYSHMSSSTLLLGAFYFTMQIYGDFSGYSDIAIGCAKLLGIRLMKNFDLPYFSRDIAEFWRKWHRSLTQWFRDYVYIPLGGSRCSVGNSIRNTFIIFLLSGLWHGANWTFICWGAYHAILFIPLLLTKTNRLNTNIVAEGRSLCTIKEFVQMSVTFMLVMIGWVLFRAESMSIAIEYLRGMCTWSLFSVPSMVNKIVLLSIAFMFFVEWCNRGCEHEVSSVRLWKKPIRYLFYWFMLAYIYLFAGNSGAFIYFQF